MGENLPLMFGLIGVVVVIAALLSGYIEKSRFPQIAVFLGLGAAVGPYGFGILDVGLEDSMLRSVATLSLALVLFTDALTIDIGEVRRHAKLAALILGPGTLIAAGLIALAAVFTLNLSWPMALILAAPLASTDPVMLRGLLKRPDLPPDARQALRLESGLNDVVLLPIVLIAMAFAVPAAGQESVSMGKLLLQMLVVGPGAGALVAWLGIGALVAIRKRVGVRRDYESLYSLGIALAAYAAAESLHGSGFLAVFAAGLTIAAVDVELCDCFLEYGETTAEILLLFTFVLLGASLIWTGLGALTLGIGLFVLLALLARPLTLLVALWKTPTDRNSTGFITWYGPRGLSTLLLILVPVFAGTPGTDRLFHIATVVVVVSVALHGGTMMVFGNRAERRQRIEASPLPVVESESEAPEEDFPIQMTPDEILARSADWNVVLADVRKEDSYLMDPLRMKGAIRLNPMMARFDVEKAGIAKDVPIAVFCSCPNDETSERVAEELRAAGWRRAFFVAGGWNALRAAGFETVSS
ncbi:MAG TPA: cation:proton antiporter [Fimbriimonadaceae bacterium]|nr:cation:proton antiporter [Fimbriimonadaceae bacterium]